MKRACFFVVLIVMVAGCATVSPSVDGSASGSDSSLIKELVRSPWESHGITVVFTEDSVEFTRFNANALGYAGKPPQPGEGSFFQVQNGKISFCTEIKSRLCFELRKEGDFLLGKKTWYGREWPAMFYARNRGRP